MSLKRFTILVHNDAQQTDEQVSMLMNLDHIVSIKPIKMTTIDREVIDGYWIRLTNEKKYRAIQVPAQILDLLEEKLPAITTSNDSQVELNIQ